MFRTTAKNSSNGKYVDENTDTGVAGTYNVAADRNVTQEELCSPIEGIGLELDSANSAQLWLAIRRAIKERRKEIGESFTLLDNRAAVAWSASSPDTYFPALCLTAIQSYTDISATNWPDLVPYLRALKVKYMDGLGGISSPTVTAFSIVSSVVKLTLTNTANMKAFLAALLEDANAWGVYRTITVNSWISTVPAGDYAITAIDPVNCTVSFAFTTTDSSGSISTSVDFYTNRIPGSTTTARVYSARGLALHGANDDNGYFVASGLRTRGRVLSHIHYNGMSDDNAAVQFIYGSTTVDVPGGATYSIQGETNAVKYQGMTSTPKSDATNPARTGNENHEPAMAVHIYMHGGRYLAS